jgi:hypothetical protein
MLAEEEAERVGVYYQRIRIGGQRSRTIISELRACSR